MRTKIIILIVKRHVGEIDWILPVLYRLNKKLILVTIFHDQASLESMKNNKNIYSLWKEICTKYTVLKKTDNTIWKITFKLFLYFGLNKFVRLRRIENFILFNVFNVPELMKKLNISINDIYYIFTANTNSSYLPNYIKKEGSKINIVRFPEATMLSPTKKENPFFKQGIKKTYNILGDFFLFSSQSDANFFFGSKINNNIKKKIIYCGIPRYEKWWIKKIVKTKKTQPKKFTILVLLRPANILFFQKKSFDNFLISMKFLADQIKGIQFIFKLHPNLDKKHIVSNYLKNINKNYWKISNSHVLYLSNFCNVCIGTMTSACLDSLANKIPTIDYYDANYELKKSSILKTMPNIAFDKNKNKWLPIFTFKKVMKNITNEKDLLDIISSIKSKKNKSSWNLYFKNFHRMVYFGRNSKNLSNFFLKNKKNW